MACKIQEPVLDGFTIEFEPSNLHLNVQDTFGNPVENAVVSIDCNGIQIGGSTDEEGCFLSLVVPNVICDIVITKECLFDFNQQFVLIDRADINDPSKNFVVKVVDTNDVPISGADVTISSEGPVHSSGQTNSNGIFKGENKNDFINTITVSKSGYQSFTSEINPFIKIECQDTGYAVVTVITLSV